MRGLSCFHCGAEVTNGLALCETCQAGARVYLEFTPVYFRNLARWKPGRAGSRPVPGSRVPPGVSFDGPKQASNNDRIGRALDEVGNDLTTWARRLHDDRRIATPEADDEVNQTAVICAWLDDNLVSISTLDWCGELVEAMSRNERRLRELTEMYVPGWYAGACKTCECGTWVVPGLTWVTCGGCGVTTYARDHLERILNEARGWVARPMRLAEAVVSLVDTEVSVPRLHKRIAKWGERERIATIRDNDYAPKRHRLGDVLDLLASEGATRLDAASTRKAS